MNPMLFIPLFLIAIVCCFVHATNLKELTVGVVVATEDTSVLEAVVNSTMLDETYNNGFSNFSELPYRILTIGVKVCDECGQASRAN